MQAGRLRRRVTIQRKTVTRDSFGAETITWQEVATVWASVEPLRGREFLESRRAEAEVTTRITIRYRAGITPEMRVVHGDDAYNIVSVIEPESRLRALVLMCRRVEEYAG